MGIEDQLAFIDSLLWNIQGVLENLGKPDATFREPAVHAFLHQRRITRVPRTAFREYERSELQRAIALLSRIHTNYKVQWRKLCEQNAQERDERRRREQLLREECYSWDAMLAWMKEHAHGQKPAELFTFEGAIGRENYFRLRAQAIRLYTLREAEDFVATHNTLNTPIGVLDAFDVVAMPEFGGTYYAPRFTTTIRQGY
jgi:hypothetical protein